MDLRSELPTIMLKAKAAVQGLGVRPECTVFTPDGSKTFPLVCTSIETLLASAKEARQYCAANNGTAVVVVYESYFLERSSYVSDSLDPIGTGFYKPEHIHVLGSTPLGNLLLVQDFYRSETGISFVDDGQYFPMVESPLIEDIWQFKEA